MLEHKEREMTNDEKMVEIIADGMRRHGCDVINCGVLEEAEIYGSAIRVFAPDVLTALKPVILDCVEIKDGKVTWKEEQ